ncbi:MAG: TlpA disulfide reductase family protein [Planctomycetota bacterium]|nr:TlpA disulfide reductase family protein [Planctomycetota bacterium]
MNHALIRRAMLSLALLTGLLLAAPASAEIAVGDKPTIKLTALDGEVVTNASLAGRIVGVVFWSTDDNFMFAGPTIDDRPILRLNGEYGLLGAKFVTISADKNPAEIRSALKQQKVTLTVVCDGKGIDGPTIKPWGVERIPYSFVLDPDGKVVWAGHPNAIESAIVKAMGATPPKLDKAVWTDLALEQVKEAKRNLTEQKTANAAVYDYRESLRRLSLVKPDVLADPKVMKEAVVLLPFFNSQREPDRLALTTIIQAYPEAAKALEAVRKARAVAASQAASRPAELTPEQKRAAAGRVKLDAAEAAEKRGDRIGAYKGYKQVAEKFAGTDEAQVAAAHVKALEADEKFMASYKLSEAESEAKSLLSMARGYRAAGKDELATQTFTQVIAKFPWTEWATEAQAGLERK